MSNTVGYSKLSTFMVAERYEIYRQFQELACQDLLYRQSELVHLERDLRDIADQDHVAGRENEEKLYAVDWRRLSTSTQHGSQSKQWAKVLEIRVKLEEYQKTLLRCKQIDGLSRPNGKDVSLLRQWIGRLDLGGGCGFIGRDLGPLYPKVYDDEFKEDLIMIRDRGSEGDAFTQLLTGPIFYTFDKFWRRTKVSKHHHTFTITLNSRHVKELKISRASDVESQNPEHSSSTNLIHYSDNHITWAVEFCGTLLASLAPMISIVTLYLIQEMPVRLVMVSIFTVALAAIVKLATRAKRVEVFAITAAFCSVQVVFVGSIATANFNNQRN